MNIEEISFLNHNEYYQKYLQLIKDNICTKYEAGKTHKHHIVPKCYFYLQKLPVDNSKNNIVNLSIKNHSLAHYYLAKCSNDKQFSKYNWLAVSNAVKISKDLITEKIIEEMSAEISRNVSGSKNYMYGKIGKQNKNSKKVYKYDLQGCLLNVYDSAVIASKENNINYGNLRSCCTNKSKSCEGYIYSYKPLEKVLYKRDYIKKPILQLDLNGNKIKLFESIKDASEQTGVSYSAIMQSLKRKTHRANNYLWYYDSDSDKIEKYQRGISSKEVILQYDLNWNLVNRFESLSDACRNVNVSKTYMKNFCLKGKGNKLREYIWKKEE